MCVAGLQLLLISGNLGKFKTEADAENAALVSNMMGLIEATFSNAGLGFITGVVMFFVFKITTPKPPQNDLNEKEDTVQLSVVSTET